MNYGSQTSCYRAKHYETAHDKMSIDCFCLVNSYIQIWQRLDKTKNFRWPAVERPIMIISFLTSNLVNILMDPKKEVRHLIILCMISVFYGLMNKTFLFCFSMMWTKSLFTFKTELETRYLFWSIPKLELPQTVFSSQLPRTEGFYFVRC